MIKHRKEGMNVYEDHWEALTRDKAFEGYLPEEVCLSLKINGSQMGRPMVKVGEYVSKGQIIGKTENEDEMQIHASLSGRVTDIFYTQYGPGIFEPFIKIKKEQKRNFTEYPCCFDFDRKNILCRMHQMGIIKDEKQDLNQIIVNGFANEPYITSGYRLIMESPAKIVLGAILAAEAISAESICIYMNEDAVDAVERMKRSIQKYGKSRDNRRPIQLLTAKRRYPFGDEHLMRKRLDMKVKRHQIFVSLAQMTALYDVIYDGEPWTKVGITVSGKVEKPKNLWVPIGTNIKELVEYCGGQGDAVIIHGGPFKGKTTNGEMDWVRKDTTGIIVLERKDLLHMPCILCGACREACPEELKPDLIEKYYLAGMARVREMKVDQCIQCGLCSYVCPAGRRLAEYIGQVKKGRVRKREEHTEKKGDYIDMPIDCKRWKGFMLFRKNKHKMYTEHEEKSQSPPHVHRKGTIQEVMYHSIFGVLPLIAGTLILYREQWRYMLIRMFVGAVSAGLAEYFWQKIRGRYETVHDGSAVFTGLLLALLLDEGTTLFILCAASVCVIIFGKQWFGGIGHAPIHPAILGKLIFQPIGVPIAEPLWYLAALSYIWMIVWKMEPWTYSFVFFLIAGCLQPAFFQSALFYIAGAYFIWSYETMPPTKKYRWLFTLAAAFLSVIFYETGLRTTGICFAVGIADAFIPWMRERYENNLPF